MSTYSRPVWRSAKVLRVPGTWRSMPSRAMLTRSISFRSSPNIWPVVLIGGLATLIALSRAGSTLFWRVGLSQLDSAELDKGRLLAASGLLLMGPLLVVLAEPALSYVAATVTQLHDLESYRMILHAGGAS